MKPTDEQLEAVARAIAATGDVYADDSHSDAWREWTPEARAAWDVIAPMVRAQALEDAVSLCECELVGTHCERETLDDCARRIRALKDKP